MRGEAIRRDVKKENSREENGREGRRKEEKGNM